MSSATERAPLTEDQENRVPERKMAPGGVPLAQTKRSVLGVLHGNKQEQHRINQKQAANKQPLTAAPIACHKPRGDNSPPKVAAKTAAMVIPVAQFEAFKVYEDNKIEEPTLPADEKIETGASVCSAPLKSLQQHLHVSPMSVERPPVAPVPNKVNRDLFFEMQEYRADIYAYLRQHEKHNRPKPGYMKKQPDITENMRSILIDWLVEVAEEYKLQTETLYLAVNFIDRFLSYMSVVRAKLQLVGTSAMFIASKYEEIFSPPVKEFVYITDNTYSQKQVIRMEHLILKVLSFDLSIPTPLTFIKAICVANKLSNKVKLLAMYISELSMLEMDHYLECLPSVLAASAIAVARHTLDEQPIWSLELTNMTGLTVNDLEKKMVFLNMLFAKAPKMAQQAIQDKYKTSKYLNVAELKPKKLVFL